MVPEGALENISPTLIQPSKQVLHPAKVSTMAEGPHNNGT